jgi:hypothetical protein
MQGEAEQLLLAQRARTLGQPMQYVPKENACSVQQDHAMHVHQTT